MAEELSKKFCLELSVMFLHVFLKTSTRKDQYIISEDAALTILKGCGHCNLHGLKYRLSLGFTLIRFKVARPSIFVDTKIYLNKLTLGCVRLGNLIYILKCGFRICNGTRNPKTDFNAEISVFGFAFLSFDWEIRKRI